MFGIGKGTREKAHRELLTLAEQILQRFERSKSRSGAVYFTVSNYPSEFRRDMHERLENLLFHVELVTKAPAELGKRGNIQEILEDVKAMQTHLSGIYPPSTQTYFRATFYAKTFTYIATLLEAPL
ncbi:hypothetical protein ACN6A1_26895 [Myxococcus virescens]|uniref:hypothetical protein n=1 Tax=Myxococcus virescens TaxID=83456 RepID=UPI003DA60177